MHTQNVLKQQCLLPKMKLYYCLGDDREDLLHDFVRHLQENLNELFNEANRFSGTQHTTPTVRNLPEEIPVNNALEMSDTKGYSKPGPLKNNEKAKLVSSICSILPLKTSPDKFNYWDKSGTGIKPKTALDLIGQLDSNFSINLNIN
ncbi:hypothetical protein DSO57_1014542 [Entomophthora muscae]|uniref:Uncharacterized protein n=1 Tax=Entomophthora muscae TaxID=34485 RepID=A0ACC2U373_9FUNG|nr:hypothetical protein DSO57_1014542 [Entomophthora muscae]